MSSYPAYQDPSGHYDDYPYPPPKPGNASVNTLAAFPPSKHPDDNRHVSRTPSPTPSELEGLKSGALDWKTLMNWRFWLRKEWILYYIIFLVIATLTILLTIFHTQIVHWLTPVATWMYHLKFGYLVPIAVLFVISFPPLFGHEIVAVLCGVVWGLWVGFAIVAVGTFLGEVGNFYAFKYCCRARGEKLERTKIFYGCLARVVREGGFPIALIARLSLIPGHFTTALFATCGMNIFVFSIAAILSSPKQFITVYLGVLLDSSSSATTHTKQSKLISDAVVGATVLVTGLAMWWILHKMNEAKPKVIYDRRKARQAKLARAPFSPYANPDAFVSSQTVGFNPRSSDSHIPLTSGEYGTSYHQKWDKDGRAVGYSGDPQLYVPQPQRASDAFAAGRMPIKRDEDADGYNYSHGLRYGRTPARQASDDSHDGSETELAYNTSPPGIPPPHNGRSPSDVMQNVIHQPPSVPAGSLSLPVPRSVAHQQEQPRSHPPHDRRQTPTQAQHVQPPGSDPAPSLPMPNFSQPSHSQAQDASGYFAHSAEKSDASFYTAYTGHSRGGTDQTTSSDV